MATTLLQQSDLPGLALRHRGKVRDVYDLPGNGEPRLLIVATDRLSAFDVVLPDPIPGKGEMLCQISNFWFDRTAHIVPNHLTGIEVASVLPAGDATSIHPTALPDGERLDTALSEALDEYERLLITRALSAANGVVAEAARRLQTDRPNLYRRMKRLGIAGGAE